ncbi:anti-sigma factor [Delftia acidovorans]|uniref:anti-sigma factor family protein n=1 Tax=Delftia acidovorans TaxID=80866 RepID=UPI0018E72EDB|nr:anti-sigma factor [Delftia acidovorans]MBJ2140473.1 anti-sigma factor [Delftia acidovorans]
MTAPAPTPLSSSSPLPPHISDEQLHALVDGRLPAQQAQALRDQLDEDSAARVEQWQRQRQLLRALHAARDEPGMPDEMRTAAEQLQGLHQRQQQWWRWGGMAAGWMLAFGLGWLVHGQQAVPAAAPSTSATLAAATPARFAHQAAVAHAVYQPEQRHPVEVEAAQQAHLLQWLSKRLGRPLKLPALTGLGYELVGGRLLPGDSGARAQFMYQDAAGERITLYLGALEDPATRGETAFHFSSDGPVPSFYWVDQGFGYALSGALPRNRLLQLATAVHQQL